MSIFTDPNVSIFDFKTGKQVPIESGKGTVNVAPGSGVILFAGTQKDFNSIRAAIK